MFQNYLKINSGVPRGFHFGSLLFILLINYLLLIFSLVDIILFANDNKMFSIIQSLNDAFKNYNQIEIDSLFGVIKTAFQQT